MSGKEPPRGPRALRVSAPTGAGPSHHHQPTASSSRQPSSSGLASGSGVVPPTGPRCLVNGLGGGARAPQTSTSSSRPYVNGFATRGRTPPSGPKGKAPTIFAPPVWPNGRPPPTGPSALAGSVRQPPASVPVHARAPISFSLKNPNFAHSKESPPPSEREGHSERPPSPSSSPPPPPPPPNGNAHPSSPPPPPTVPPPPTSPRPPPPAEVPHDRSPISIRLPSAHPQEPRLAPPPLPPPPSEPPKVSTSQAQPHSHPQPPSSEPPPLPPSDPRRLASIPHPPRSYARSPSPQRRVTKVYTRPPSPPRRPPSPERPPTPLPDGVTVLHKHVHGHQRPQKVFSLHAPPMPDRSTYTPVGDERDYQVLFDSSCDKDRYGETKMLIDKLRSIGKEDRIKDMGKGKVIVYRYEGETIKGEKEARTHDTRKEPGFKGGKLRNEFHTTSYEYDSNSVGPAPPTNIVVFGFSELTQTAKIRQHFQKYGSIVTFDRELDRVTGGQLGVASIGYATHDEARRAVEGEEGKNFTLAAIGAGPIVSFAGAAKGVGSEKDSVKVMFDGEGKLTRLVIGLYEEKKRKEKERGRLQALGGESGVNASTPGSGRVLTPTVNGQATGQQQHASSIPRGPYAYAQSPGLHQHPGQRPPPPLHSGPHISHPNHAKLPPHPLSHVAPNRAPPVGPSYLARGLPVSHQHHPGCRFGVHGPGLDAQARRQPPPSLVRARAMNTARSTVPQNMPVGVHGLQTPETDSRPLTPVQALRGRGGGARGLAYDLAHSHSRTHTPTSASTPRGSRSPSPALAASMVRRPDAKQTHAEREAKHRAVMQALVRNGFDHARIDEAELSGGAAREDDVREFFKGFPVDEVLHDHMGWYITFRKPDAAGRAARVLAIGTHTLANRSVSVSVRPAPLPEDVGKTLSPASLATSVGERRVWKPEEMIEEAGKKVLAELRALLEKDVMERIVSAQIRKLISESRERKEREGEVDKVHGSVLQDVRQGKGVGVGDVDRERRRLKGLSFKKRKQKAESVSQLAPELDQEKEHDGSDDVGLVVTTAEEEPLVAVTLTEDDDAQEVSIRPPEKEERPRKRRKKAEVRVVQDKEIESEDEDIEVGVKVEDPTTLFDDVPVDVVEPAVVSPVQRKRSLTPTPVEEPPIKRSKLSEEDVDEKVVLPVPIVVSATPTKKNKKTTTTTAKKADKVEKEKKTTKRPKKAKADRTVLESLVIPQQMEVEAPSVAEVHVSPSPAWQPTEAKPPLPVLSEKAPPSPKRHNPLPESVLREIAEDDEDLYFAKLALSLDVEGGKFSVREETAATSDPNAPAPFRKHVTGSARSEGYYKISHAEKSAYVAQYALRGAANEGPVEKESVAPQQPVVSSRSNRANARRRAQGLEEMNQLQLAVALSKGESAATEVMKFNQLQTRKKHLRFARSPIHDWGLYAMERISRGEMVIEYVGEVIRAAVADKREKAYERQGIGSSYLFRIDEDLVVDATKKGNLGRLINHSCDPNCTAKIITINGEKKIVIYAKQEIELGDEITYDYHFPIEQDKIPCLCGSAKCRGFLN